MCSLTWWYCSTCRVFVHCSWSAHSQSDNRTHFDDCSASLTMAARCLAATRPFFAYASCTGDTTPPITWWPSSRKWSRAISRIIGILLLSEAPLLPAALLWWCLTKHPHVHVRRRTIRAACHEHHIRGRRHVARFCCCCVASSSCEIREYIYIYIVQTRPPPPPFRLIDRFV